MTEYQIYKQIRDYLTLQYPDVIAHFDSGSGMKLTMGQAVKQKRINPKRGYPDLFIAEPRGCYHGLYLEIKKDGEKVFKKDGEVYANEHLIEQREFLSALSDRGYYTQFVIGFVQARQVIDYYLGLKIIT